MIIIDREYLGYDKLLKRFILETAERNGKKVEKENIHFQCIGKKSNAHKVALKTFQTKKSDIRLTSKEFFDESLAK